MKRRLALNRVVTGNRLAIGHLGRAVDANVVVLARTGGQQVVEFIDVPTDLGRADRLLCG